MPTAHLNGIDVNYEVHGTGTPLVLAHGYSASLEMWRDHVAPLAERHRVVIYDTRGHGQTTAPADLAHYDLARDYVADMLALVDHLGIGRAHIGGLSMGGMIAQEFALQHPQRLRSLLLFDTGPGMNAVARDPAMVARFEQFRGIMQKVARTGGMSSVIDAMRNSPMAISRGAGPVPGSVLRHLDGMRQMDVDGYLGGARAMQEWPGTLDRLHTISVPSLVVVGENDNLLAASKVIAGRIPNSRFVLLRRCSHGSTMWRPNAWLRETRAFLEDAEANRPTAGSRIVD